MKGEKTYELKQLFTAKEMRTIELYWVANAPNDFHRKVLSEIVEPAMVRIDHVTGQKNDAKYIAYALEATMAANWPLTKA